MLKIQWVTLNKTVLRPYLEYASIKIAISVKQRHQILRYQKVMSCYDFWRCCEPLNEENLKQNFVSFGIKLKKL
jgi:hypothetical protein